MGVALPYVGKGQFKRLNEFNLGVVGALVGLNMKPR